jgi:hypothetical protein
LGALLIGSAAFFVVDRYRIHLVPPLALLTGIGAEQFITRWKRDGWRSTWTLAGIAVAGMAITLAPLIPEAIDRSGAMQRAGSRAGRLARANMYESAGTTYALLGDDQRSIECFAMAVQLAPDAASARAHFAEQLALCGRLDDARAQYAAAGVPLQQATSGLVGMAAREHWPADSVAIRKYLSAAAGILPGFEQATVPLLRLEIMTGSLERASSVLRTAEANGLDENVARVHAAWIRAALGDTTGARKILEAIPAGVRSGDPRVVGTLELLRQQTGWNPR